MRLLAASGDAELARDAVGDHLARDGLAMIRQGSVNEVRALLAGWTEPYTHPHDHEPGLTVITPDRRADTTTGDAGFTRAPLLPHTDRSLYPQPPSVLAAVMVSPAATGGHTLLADGAAVLGTLRRVHPLTTIGRSRLHTASGDLVPIFVIREGLARIRFVTTRWRHRGRMATGVSSRRCASRSRSRCGRCPCQPATGTSSTIIATCTGGGASPVIGSWRGCWQA